MHKRKETTPVLYLLRPDCLPLIISNLTNQTNLECLVFHKIPLSLDSGAQMRWDKDHSTDY